MCLGRESNPYGHCWPRDFKSRVSTYSTTKANRIANIVKFLVFYQNQDAEYPIIAELSHPADFLLAVS